MKKDLNKLIGIPFKISKEDFNGCDCVGICWLYHKYVHGKNYPHRDGKRLWIRNKKHDIRRILKVIRTWAHEVLYSDLEEGDIVLMNGKDNTGVLGVCIDGKKILYMNEVFGSCLVKKSSIKQIFIKAFRPNNV